MNDHYGVDPCAASTILELVSLLRQFGPEHGRFIVNFPYGWQAQVEEAHYVALGDLERMRLRVMLERIAKQCLLPTPTRYSAALPWVKNAEHLKDVQGLIGPAGSKPPFRTVVDVLSDPDALPDCRGGHISRTPAAYADVARPLLQISTKVVLIDPYFHLRYRTNNTIRPANRYVSSLKALIRAAEAEKVSVFKLMVNAERALISGANGMDFEADLDAIKRSVGASKIEIEYALLDERNSLDRHPRYLLGNECGLRFDWGLDVSDDNSTNHVEWVGRAALKPILRRFF